MVIVHITRGTHPQIPERREFSALTYQEILDQLEEAGIGNGYFYLSDGKGGWQIVDRAKYSDLLHTTDLYYAVRPVVLQAPASPSGFGRLLLSPSPSSPRLRPNSPLGQMHLMSARSTVGSPLPAYARLPYVPRTFTVSVRTPVSVGQVHLAASRDPEHPRLSVLARPPAPIFSVPAPPRPEPLISIVARGGPATAISPLIAYRPGLTFQQLQTEALRAYGPNGTLYYQGQVVPREGLVSNWGLDAGGEVEYVFGSAIPAVPTSAPFALSFLPSTSGPACPSCSSSPVPSTLQRVSSEYAPDYAPPRPFRGSESQVVAVVIAGQGTRALRFSNNLSVQDLARSVTPNVQSGRLSIEDPETGRYELLEGDETLQRVDPKAHVHLELLYDRPIVIPGALESQFEFQSDSEQ